MLNLKGFTLLKPSLYDLIGIVTRSAWQGYKPQNLVAPRDIPNIKFLQLRIKLINLYVTLLP